MSTAPWSALRVDGVRLLQRLQDLGQFGALEGGGTNRLALSDADKAGRDWTVQQMRNLDMAVQVDAIGNVVGTCAGTEDLPPVMTGSHIDTVRTGGLYDGNYGVMAGLEVVATLRAAGVRTRRPLQVAFFTNEEGARFQPDMMGSLVMVGGMALQAALATQAVDNAATVGDELARIGYAGSAPVGAPVVDSFVELHIEQGPVMVARKIPVGVVSGIRGNVRHNKIECFGEAQHSGVVPRWLRKDAVFAVSDLIVRVDNHWRALLERGTDLVVTCGVVQTNPAEHSISRVPGYAHFSFEARSKSSDTLEAFYQLVQAEMNSIERERGVQFKADRRLLSEPAVTDPHLCDLMAKACRDRGIAHERIPSGAGHDAALFANGGIPSAMVFVRNQNGSHNPYEAMELSDFMLGTQVMADTIAAITPRAASH